MKERKGWTTADGNVYIRKETDLHFKEPRLEKAFAYVSAMFMTALNKAVNS